MDFWCKIKDLTNYLVFVLQYDKIKKAYKSV